LKSKAIEQDFYLEDINPIDFYGANNSNLNQIKDAFPDVRFIARGNSIKTLGDAERLETILRILHSILNDIRIRGPITGIRLAELLRNGGEEPIITTPIDNDDVLLHGVSGNVIRAKTPGQRAIVEQAAKNDMVFAIGPAGSGKSYTAVAVAARALKNKQVRKIVLCRPAVEAGERLGFLPGDLKEKIDPYLRPLYDALEDMIHAEKLKFLMEKNIIEIVPLAYMRGRTLNNAFIILDEAQNATEMQLKMFLTRMGIGSKIIVTGDVTQIDLPRTQRSGLIQCMNILKNIEGIGFVMLDERDVVRHPLIKSILKAYDKVEAEIKERREKRLSDDEVIETE
jgi:phosphate starvation-inducible PhoH-like protein